MANITGSGELLTSWNFAPYHLEMPTDPRVDQYILSAPAFSRPVLRHLRDLVQKGCPEMEETIKWSRPVFLYRSKISFFMAAFQAHCSFGFWHPEIRKSLAADGIKQEESSGSLGRIRQLADLPPDDVMLRYIQEARRLADEQPSNGASKTRKALPKTEAAPPGDFAAALDKNQSAAKAFHGSSPSHRREYIEWIAEAKRDETRQKRIASALAWLVEGKPRNWKYGG